MPRPSEKELFKRIKEAKEAIAEGRIALINPLAVASDALELGYLIGEELESLLAELVDRLAPAQYVGTRPPQRSYEQTIKGLELFAFEVDSPRFESPVYLKFALSPDGFWLVSLHKGRTSQEEA
jgi:hypothetical protein